jgi:hypothetical protein
MKHLNSAYSKPFVDLSPHIDLEGFDKLHPEICKGFVLSKTRNLSYRGNLFLDKTDQDQVNLDIYNGTIKPVWYRYEEYLKLSDTDPIKIIGSTLNDSELGLYLKYVLDAYDPYQVFPLFTTNESKGRELSTMAELFPNVIRWIDKISVFSHVSNAHFLLLEADGVSIEHCDPKADPNILREFVHIRSGLDRPFYVKNSKESKKTYIDARACYFNDQDWHGGDGVRKSSYTLRIDGTFTNDFRKILKNV